MSPLDVTPAARDLSRLGTIRRLDRCATADGFLTVAAIDHPATIMAGPGGAGTSDAEVVANKHGIIEGLVDHASALLLDPVHSLGQVIATGGLPGHVGLISNIELLEETPEGVGRATAVRPGWTPDRIARIGADAVKFVFFHREEATDDAAEQRSIVSGLVERCRALDLPLIIEPLWYPRDGDGDAELAARPDAIIRAAATFAGLGADIMKLQFPGSVSSVAERADATAAARALDDALEVPWVLLSEGVGFDDFAVQVQLAARAGVSGFMAGRAVWGDVTRARGHADRQAAIARAAHRLDVLSALVRIDGRPWRERPSLDRVQADLPIDWLASYPDAASA